MHDAIRLATRTLWFLIALMLAGTTTVLLVEAADAQGATVEINVTTGEQAHVTITPMTPGCSVAGSSVTLYADEHGTACKYQIAITPRNPECTSSQPTTTILQATPTGSNIMVHIDCPAPTPTPVATATALPTATPVPVAPVLPTPTPPAPAPQPQPTIAPTPSPFPTALPTPSTEPATPEPTSSSSSNPTPTSPGSSRSTSGPTPTPGQPRPDGDTVASTPGAASSAGSQAATEIAHTIQCNSPICFTG